MFVVSCSMATKLLKLIAHSMQLGVWSDNTRNYYIRLNIFVGTLSQQNSMSAHGHA